ncbi:MAG TPA: phosphoadenosine phosphosulfate reductase family protein [Pyrinomonadaceae bacterium]|nr:phosphoadenosine phosphosulfate reductase family protein [Pyrinomonadaceae bacterium]
MARNKHLFEEQRMTMQGAIDLTVESLREYGRRYDHWGLAYSGGKDSSATATLVIHLIESGQVPAPKSLTVLYADTRMELPPLQISAMGVLEEIRRRGSEVRVVLPPMDQRYFVYMLGRGVPPPSNTFRWCTPRLKVQPMLTALKEKFNEVGEKFLMLTGVRLGESAARDQRIAMSCSRDGAECGQGWFQEATPQEVADTLSPLIHWRVCHVWDWLMFYAPDLGFPTVDIAESYGGDEAQEVNARTGCVGCNLVEEDRSLNMVLRLPRWKYLTPLQRLRPLYRELKEPHLRLRKVDERNSSGVLAAKQGRLGPLTFEARRYGLERVLKIQDDINKEARRQGRPELSLINAEEQARIEELIEAKTWPQGWAGTEIRGDELFELTIREGLTQPLLPNILVKG